ncbi:hypothetical protein PIB30_089625 [Stylosanthes scabra]|uniref:EXPERA domain-containing protein n=1 Tax=Stylosanthes scabra TaxID=79078 RepID=A0ABU6VXP1_9FABA|nr:hypothetical protein [Stylosanthes scabra]
MRGPGISHQPEHATKNGYLISKEKRTPQPKAPNFPASTIPFLSLHSHLTTRKLHGCTTGPPPSATACPVTVLLRRVVVSSSFVSSWSVAPWSVLLCLRPPPVTVLLCFRPPLVPSPCCSASALRFVVHCDCHSVVALMSQCCNRVNWRFDFEFDKHSQHSRVIAVRLIYKLKLFSFCLSFTVPSLNKKKKLRRIWLQKVTLTLQGTCTFSVTFHAPSLSQTFSLSSHSSPSSSFLSLGSSQGGNRRTDRLLMCWWAFTGLTHIIVEGYFVFAPEFYKDKTGFYLAEVWKEYSKGDSRYAGRDAGIVSIEGLTAVFGGPASLLAV